MEARLDLHHAAGILALSAYAALLIVGTAIEFEGAACEISGSIGIALSQDYPRPDPDRMQQDADAALYRSKRAGTARYAFAGETTTHTPEPVETAATPSASQ